MTDSETERGGAFYDDEQQLDRYLAHRHAAVTSPNLVMEEPAFMLEAGDLSGLRVLDLGCGDGTFSQRSLELGCESYLGIDGSSAMIERCAAWPRHPRVSFRHGDIEDVSLPPASVDLVVSRLALHYVRDLGPVIERARESLIAGGRLIFSVVHPVVTASVTEPVGQRAAVVVDDYFRSGDRRRAWFGKPVHWQHRPIETYVDAVIGAGFGLTAVRECAPVEHLFAGDDAEFDRRRRVPLFLLISARA